MTNTQQTVLSQVSRTEQPQDEIQFTELQPVERSRIKYSKNDKDTETTDGLKVLRSIAQDHEDLDPQHKLFRKIHENNEGHAKIQTKTRKKCQEPWKPLSDDEEEEFKTKTTVYRQARRTKRKSSDFSWSDEELTEIDSDEEEIVMKKSKKPNGRCKKVKKIKDKNSLNDEVYYYRQSVERTTAESDEDDEFVGFSNNVFQDMADNFSGTSNSKVSTNKTKKSDERMNSCKNVETPVKSKDTEKDVKLKIDVIIQSNYNSEKENNNDAKDNGQLENSSHLSIEPTNSASLNAENRRQNDKTTCTKEDLNTKKFCCLMCDAKFKGSGGLRNHWKVMHGNGPLFKCDDCGKEFPLKERLKLHMRTHTGYKPYKCTDCDKCFARGGQLTQHRRTHKPNLKPFHCTLCTRKFTSAANLALHMKRHSGQKDHKCDLCGRKFVRKDALKKHLQCLHGDVKSFLCIICNKTFKGHLPQHMRTHCQDRPHGCATCGQKFAQKSQLTVHQRTHSGQRPFRCLVCWQAFAHSTALKLHIRRHTGERPFKCSLCDAGFTQLPHWKKHMKCIHGRNKPYDCKNCSKHFKMKTELETHEKTCTETEDSADNRMSTSKDNDGNVYVIMNIEKMRLHLAVLLKKISKPEKLDELGFGKRLIDEILKDSLVNAGKKPVKNGKFGEFESLRKNLAMFLEWTVPKEHWEAFQKLNKTPEEILETLTAA